MFFHKASSKFFFGCLQTRPALDGKHPLLESMFSAVPVDRKIKCLSGDRRESRGRGDLPFFVFYTVHERKTRWQRGSAAQCKKHELSAPPFSLKIKFYSSTILQEAWVCKKKKSYFCVRLWFVRDATSLYLRHK